MKRFSERSGLVAPARTIQTEGMSEELRNSLWNALDEHLWQTISFVQGNSLTDARMYNFSYRLWSEFFKAPVDSRAEHALTILGMIRQRYFALEWYEVYEFLEWIIGWTMSTPHLRQLQSKLNEVMERELAGYRFVRGVYTDITHERK
jgi:hypothetical protein